MIYVISSVHPISDSRIYYRQVLSLAKQYSVKFYAQEVKDWRPEKIHCVALPAGESCGSGWETAGVCSGIPCQRGQGYSFS